jgi:hypothetical protein
LGGFSIFLLSKIETTDLKSKHDRNGKCREAI